MPYVTDARRIGDHVAGELQLTFVEAGFWLEARGAVPVSGRTYVDIAPIPADVAARLVERVREWAAR